MLVKLIPIIYRYNKDTSYEATNYVKNFIFLKSTGEIAIRQTY